MDAFHFKERIKLFGESGASIIFASAQRETFQKQIGRIVRNYSQANRRLLKYRNFVVHGPQSRVDEFADLRSWELSSLLLHNDLWFEYNNAFDSCRSDWTVVSRDLIRAMERAAAEIQILNENCIETAVFGFARRSV
jgi:hypothetical protein